MNNLKLNFLVLLSCVLLVRSEHLTICQGAYHGGPCADYYSNGHDCQNFNFVTDEIGSVDTHGNCFTFYKDRNCGRAMAYSILPGSKHHNNLAELGYRSRVYRSFEKCRLSNSFYLDVLGS